MIPDSAIRKAGYNPDTRKRYAGEVSPPKIILGCSFFEGSSSAYGLKIASSNTSLAEDKKFWENPAYRHDPVTTVTVNGRDGFSAKPMYQSEKCYLYFPTKFGDVALIRTSMPDSMSYDPCTGMVDLAELIEPTVGADN
ncbi:hypothetical protein NONO_c62920 [Nocardia nova SH22a]|uniref:Uncharacterized protein n=2 Tax=Nocardia nova TaxID=37330 RepID=W5TP80_9NOCA|nr:hypothetical protein NONO_c62920 [Nocardia nova SH22a]